MTETTDPLAYEEAPNDLLELLVPGVRDFLQENDCAMLSPSTTKALAARMVRAYQKRTADQYRMPSLAIEAATALSKTLEAKSDTDFLRKIVDAFYEEIKSGKFSATSAA